MEFLARRIDRLVSIVLGTIDTDPAASGAIPRVSAPTRNSHHFGSANSVTTATVATTVCINTSIAWALGVTPANRRDLVKLSRSGSANDSASAQTATNRNIFSGCVETSLRTAYVREAITTPPTHPESIGSRVKGGKSLGTWVKRSPASAIMMSIANAKVHAN